MAKLVVHGAVIRCSQGSSTAKLSVPRSAATGDEDAAATVQHHAPTVNIPPFGMCRAPANPQVAAATAAAQGALTPAPCLPVIPAPWAPGAAYVTIDGVPALTDTSTCSCSYAGEIKVEAAGSGVDVD
jgi:hypothetical protein